MVLLKGPVPVLVLVVTEARQGQLAGLRVADRGAAEVGCASRPSRRTAIRSATEKTLARLWLITITPRPRSRSRSISFRIWAVWTMPSAAVWPCLRSRIPDRPQLFRCSRHWSPIRTAASDAAVRIGDQ